MYRIARINDMGDFDRAEEFAVLHYLWGSTYQPEVKGKLAWLEGKGFHLQMVCRETNPTRVYTTSNAPVYKDSCMEAFLDFKPEAGGPGYVNFEMNANGAMLCAIGTSRNDRTFLAELGVPVPQPMVRLGQDSWQIDLSIPLTLIHRLYGPLEIAKGYRLRGNFYKCGDGTPSVHYGSWARVGSERPDFHLPQYFGDMVVE